MHVLSSLITQDIPMLTQRTWWCRTVAVPSCCSGTKASVTAVLRVGLTVSGDCWWKNQMILTFLVQRFDVGYNKSLILESQEKNLTNCHIFRIWCCPNNLKASFEHHRLVAKLSRSRFPTTIFLCAASESVSTLIQGSLHEDQAWVFTTVGAVDCSSGFLRKRKVNLWF